MSSLHIATLPKISFKNLTPGLYTSNYGNYKMQSIKHYTQINIENQPLQDNLLEHSPESLRTFPEIFWNIPRSLLEHSPESSSTFPGNFWNIPLNVKIITFPGILKGIPRNPSEHSPRSPHSASRSCIPGRRPEAFLGKCVLKICSKFTGKHHCGSAI